MIDNRIDRDMLSQSCDCNVPAPGHRGLIDCVNRCTGLDFRLLYTEDDWYRPGGVVDGAGTRITDNLEAWAESESQGDPLLLYAMYSESGLYATAVAGKTYYLVAPTGAGPLDFAQVEIDEIEEVVDRELFDPLRLPDSLEDIVDPMDYERAVKRPLSEPRYVFRTVTFFSDKAGELVSEFGGDPRFRRFLAEWERSSAGPATRFCDHFVLNVVPYLDALGDHKLEVRVMSPDETVLRSLSGTRAERGPELADRVRGVDRDAGYPMAWYFLMLARNYLPYASVQAISQNYGGVGGGFAYLPANDQEIVERWLQEPYHL